jgi:glycosyltransferase involved in cell wall biosynthesis
VVVLCQDDACKYHLCDNRFMPKVIYNPLTLKPDTPSSGNSKKFLTIGRFTPLHKGIDILIEAFSIFANQNKDWHLDIVGEGVEGTKYKTMIQQYQLEDRITIHPFTKQIQHYYSQAQVYVLSSRWEGMPLVLVEAMSHGLPIVGFEVPYSLPYQQGFIGVEMFDVKGLARETVKLLKDYNYRKKMGNIAKKSLDVFKNNETVELWGKLCDSLMSEDRNDYRKFQKEIEDKYYDEKKAREMIQDVDVHANPIQDNASVVVIGIE